MTVDLDQRLELADQVLEAVRGLPESTVAVVARSLIMDGGPMRGFGMALDGALAPPDSWLARLQVAREIRVLARHQDLVDRLADAREQPWVALSEAITAAHESETASPSARLDSR